MMRVPEQGAAMRTRSLLGIALAVAILVGACSSDDETSNATEATEATEATDATSVPTTVLPTTTVPSTAPVPSAGCGTTPSVEPGEVKVDTTSGGVTRWYWRNVPSAYNGAVPVPLVLDFHGYSEGADVHLMMSEMRQRGQTEGFVTITPQGTGPVARWDTGFDSPDMVFVGDLLDEVEATLCIDRRMVFATGLSNGAGMTSAVACVYADRIAAFAPVAGIRAPDDCEPARPAPVLAFHGTEDDFIPYEGGVGEAARDLPAADGSGRTIGDDLPDAVQARPSIPGATAAWAARNGCDPEPTTSDAEFADDVVVIDYDCPDGADVQLLRIDGGGHAWPGSAFSQQLESLLGFTNMTLDANGVMFNFFVHHRLPAELLEAP
jgi:polyhydroxybutyrate depolymerase